MPAAADLGSWASCRRLGQLVKLLPPQQAAVRDKSRGDSQVAISLRSTCEGATYPNLFGSILDP